MTESWASAESVDVEVMHCSSINQHLANEVLREWKRDNYASENIYVLPDGEKKIMLKPSSCIDLPTPSQYPHSVPQTK